MPNSSKTMEELKEMAVEYCKLKKQERELKARTDPMKDEFDKMLNPGETIQCELGTVGKTKKGKAGFAYLTKDGEVEMSTFKQILIKKGWASATAGNPYIECKLSEVVE